MRVVAMSGHSVNVGNFLNGPTRSTSRYAKIHALAPSDPPPFAQRSGYSRRPTRGPEHAKPVAAAQPSFCPPGVTLKQRIAR